MHNTSICLVFILISTSIALILNFVLIKHISFLTSYTKIYCRSMYKKAILLVEDDVSDVCLVKRVLEKDISSIRLVVAQDGQEALDNLFGAGAENMPRLPALVLLDLKLPGMDGLEVLRRIRRDGRTRRLPVVILTSSGEKVDIAMCYDMGANSYIQKPVDFTEFAEAIRQLSRYWLTLNEFPATGW